MVDSWLKALNAGKLIGCVMVDFRKAFDLVDHQIIFKKNYSLINVIILVYPGLACIYLTERSALL